MMKTYDGEPAADKVQYSATPKSETASRFEFQVYAAPSLGFRESRNDKDLPVSSGKEANEENINKHIDVSVMNIETGGNILYQFNPFMRLKAG